MAKFLTAVSCAVLLWTFWNASSVGVYVGTYTSQTDGKPQCRYVAAHGVYDEARDEAIAAHSKNLKWCPATYEIAHGKDVFRKPNGINTASGL